MKKSEFVKEIKNYIYEILSEAEDTPAEKTAKDLEIKAQQAKIKAAQERIANLNKGLSEEVQSTDPAVKKIEDKMEKDPEFLKKTKEAMAKAEKGDTTDLAIMMAGFGKMFESEDDQEPTKAELAKKDSITTSANKLQKLVAKMKELAKEYVDAKGDKKEKIKDELKKLTAEKKALEKAILPSSEED